MATSEQAVATIRTGPARGVIPAADIGDAMREQLDFLIEHAAGGNCGCAFCQRYQEIRSMLCEIFG